MGDSFIAISEQVQLLTKTLLKLRFSVHDAYWSSGKSAINQNKKMKALCIDLTLSSSLDFSPHLCALAEMRVPSKDSAWH